MKLCVMVLFHVYLSLWVKKTGKQEGIAAAAAVIYLENSNKLF
jgi:hypothetical protein